MSEPTTLPHPAVPTRVLQELARHTPERDRGELSPEHGRILAMYLTEICHELLIARRLSDHARRVA